MTYYPSPVIPAQAGILFLCSLTKEDSRFRGNDGVWR
jgi:hypothetical protein